MALEKWGHSRFLQWRELFVAFLHQNSVYCLTRPVGIKYVYSVARVSTQSQAIVLAALLPVWRCSWLFSVFLSYLFQHSDHRKRDVIIRGSLVMFFSKLDYCCLHLCIFKGKKAQKHNCCQWITSCECYLQSGPFKVSEATPDKWCFNCTETHAWHIARRV